jgi:hypothetical protein
MRCAQFATRFWVTLLKRLARVFACIGLAVGAYGIAAAAAPGAPLDSQDVLLRYQRALVALPTPKTIIFTYSVSQAGPHNLEQTHLVYRSGELVRDETIAAEGQTLKRKIVRVSRYPDRYAIARVAPHASEYAFLFQGVVHVGTRVGYEYTAIPTQRGGAYVVDAMTIDAATFLPMSIRFTMVSGSVKAKGELRYARAATYWLPQFAVVEARFQKSTARERISFSGYRFPATLPDSTFRSLKPLPAPATLPSF